MRIYTEAEKTYNQIFKKLKKDYPEIQNIADFAIIQNVEEISLNKIVYDIQNYHIFKINFKFNDPEIQKKYDLYLEKTIDLIKYLKFLERENRRKYYILTEILTPFLFGWNGFSSYSFTNNYILIDYKSYKTKYGTNIVYDEYYAVLKNLIHDISVNVKLLFNYIQSLDLDELIDNLDRYRQFSEQLIENQEELEKHNYNFKFQYPIRRYCREGILRDINYGKSQVFFKMKKLGTNSFLYFNLKLNKYNLTIQNVDSPTLWSTFKKRFFYILDELTKTLLEKNPILSNLDDDAKGKILGQWKIYDSDNIFNILKYYFFTNISSKTIDIKKLI